MSTLKRILSFSEERFIPMRFSGVSTREVKSFSIITKMLMLIMLCVLWMFSVVGGTRAFLAIFNDSDFDNNIIIGLLLFSVFLFTISLALLKRIVVLTLMLIGKDD